MKRFDQQTYYELLELPTTASSDEIRAAYERSLEVYAPDSPALYGLADPSQVDELRKRLLEAMEILTDEDLRVEYDRSIGLPPRSKPPADEAPQQLAMTDVLAFAEATHSTHPDYRVSYMPHLPPPEYAATVSVDAVASPTNSAEVVVPRPPESAPVAATAAEPVASAPPLERRVTPAPFAPDSVRVAEPLPEAPGEVSTSRYVESVDGVVSGPKPLDAAQEMSHESAIAEAEAALAHVASRVRDRPEVRAKAPEISPEAEFNGELLRRVRESRGMTLQTLADRTRIAARHLENVEADRYEALPTTVYLRGMLMSVARELGLDALRVAKSYLALVTGKSK